MNKFLFAAAAVIVSTIEATGASFSATATTKSPVALDETMPSIHPTTVSTNWRFDVRPKAMHLIETAPAQLGALYKTYRYNPLITEFFDKMISAEFSAVPTDYSLFAYGRIEMKALPLYDTNNHHSVSNSTLTIVLAPPTLNHITSSNVTIAISENFLNLTSQVVVKNIADDRLEAESSNTTSIDTKDTFVLDSPELYELYNKRYRYSALVTDLSDEMISAVITVFPEYYLFAYGRVEMKALPRLYDTNKTPSLNNINFTNVTGIAVSSSKAMNLIPAALIQQDFADIMVEVSSKESSNSTSIDTDEDIAFHQLMDTSRSTTRINACLDDASNIEHHTSLVKSELPPPMFAPLVVATNFVQRLVLPQRSIQVEEEDSQLDEMVSSVEYYGPITKQEWRREVQEDLDSLVMTPEEIEAQVRINEMQRRLQRQRKQRLEIFVGGVTIMAVGTCLVLLVKKNRQTWLQSDKTKMVSKIMR